jgi:tight adherence protein C
VHAASQIRYVTLADGRRQERRIPFLFRVLLPLTPGPARLASHPALAVWRERTDARLIAAGYEGLVGAEEAAGLSVLMMLGGLLPGIALRSAPLAAVGAIVGFAYPAVWLRGALNRRHRSIQRSLPFVLDLLTISVEAGVDFMAGLRKILDRRELDPLGEELLRAFHEIRLGKTRRQSLRSMADRVQQPDLVTVANALAQADELGVSLGAILRIQADQLRVKRFLRAEQLAHEAPVKILGPLVLFIFPAVFIILLGPILMRFFSQGF